MTKHTQGWQESVEEHRETIEKIAETDTPLADDMQQLLEEYKNAQ